MEEKIKQIRVENQHIPESEVRRLVMLKPDLNPEDPLLAELFGKLNDQYGMHGKNKDKFDEFFGFNYKSLKSYHVKHDCGGSVRRFYERFHENHLTILVPDIAKRFPHDAKKTRKRNYTYAALWEFALANSPGLRRKLEYELQPYTIRALPTHKDDFFTNAINQIYDRASTAIHFQHKVDRSQQLFDAEKYSVLIIDKNEVFTDALAKLHVKVLVALTKFCNKPYHIVS